MDFWTAIVCIVAISACIRLAHMKQKNRQAGQATAEQNAALAERLDKLERRMANLETIVLEHEKIRNFERSL